MDVYAMNDERAQATIEALRGMYKNCQRMREEAFTRAEMVEERLRQLMKGNMMFTRQELQDIASRAAAHVATRPEIGTPFSPFWTRAYQALADAADRLDAMIARTMEIESARDDGDRDQDLP